MLVSDEEMSRLSDPKNDQFFLTDVTTIDTLLSACQLSTTDSVIEIGAGVGTIAARIPQVESLTLVDLDSRFAEPLRIAAPRATVITGDGIQYLVDRPCNFEVVISNLSWSATPRLLRILPAIRFRIALVMTGRPDDLDQIRDSHAVQEVLVAHRQSFTPNQYADSYLYRVTRASLAG